MGKHISGRLIPRRRHAELQLDEPGATDILRAEPEPRRAGVKRIVAVVAAGGLVGMVGAAPAIIRPVEQDEEASAVDASTVIRVPATENLPQVRSKVTSKPAPRHMAAKPKLFSAPRVPAAPKTAPRVTLAPTQVQAVPAPAPAPVAAAAAPAAPVAAPAPPPPAAHPSGHSTSRGMTIANAALAQIGVTQDCTALVSNSLAAAGIHFHGWPADYLRLGPSVGPAGAQPGDILFYANGGTGVPHVAIYIGGGMAVHGGWNGNQTVEATAYVGSGPVFIQAV